MLCGLLLHLQGRSAPVLPALIGDLNYVINQIDTGSGFSNQSQIFTRVVDIVRDFWYIDAFCVLFSV